MLYGLRISSRADVELGAPVMELLQSTLRTLILATGAVLFAWYLATNLSVKLFATIVPVSAVLSVYCGASGAALWLNRRSLLAALAVWVLGLAGSILVSMVVFSRPDTAFLYLLLPLVASIVGGWPAGAVTEALVAGVVVWLSTPGTGLGVALPRSHATVIVAGGLLAGLIGWIATRSLLIVTEWYVASWKTARQEAELARDQRLQLKETQEDLMHANSELARLSDRLKAMYQVAEEARQVKEQFVANVSHELRTPLNMIIGFSEMIVQSPQTYGERLPPPLLADITAIHRNSQHLAKLVNDVLDLSQVETGRIALSREWATLDQVVAEAVDVVRPLFSAKKLFLDTDVAPDLPHVYCDVTRIRQVIINLLSNAGRFTERGGVRVTARSRPEDVVITVMDTGPGIPEEVRAKLFEPFQQFDASIRRRHGGAGLGLSISKRFVEMHGGRMWLDCGEGEGASFSLTLPLHASGLGDLPSDGTRRWFSPYSDYTYRQRTRPSRATAPPVPTRFIVLEEGETLQRLFARYLDDVETVAVRDMEGAIAEANRLPAQAVVVNTPNFRDPGGPLDGLARLSYGTPVVACWVPAEESAAERLGVTRYLVKPITREALMEALAGVSDGLHTVLLVDDEPDILQLYARMLTSPPCDYDVLQARNGSRALALLRRRKPDVLLLDLLMPGLDGFRVLQEMSGDPALRDIPVIIITSRDPSGAPIASEALTVTRSGGLGARDLLACIREISSILSPTPLPARQAPPETQPG